MILPEHLNFILCVLLGLVFTSPLGAAEDLVFMKTWPSGGGRAIYQMPLLVNGSDPTSADTVHNSDDMADTGFTYNYKTRSVLWSEGKEVKSLNIDDDSISILADVSVTFSQLSSVTDLGVDGYGNIYFAAVDTLFMGFIGKIDAQGTVTQLYQVSTTNQVFNAISVDPIGQSVFGALKPSSIAVTYIKRLEGSTLSNIITTSETITSIAVDINEQNVYYSDGVKIFYTNYTTPNGQNEFFQDTFASSITDLDVAGDYIYFVGSNNQKVVKINKYDSSDVTRIGPNIIGINWLDVVLASESVVLCDTTGLPHVTVSADCTIPMAGVSCDYTCDYGYEKNPPDATITCGDNTGLWDLSTPCRAMDDLIIVRQNGVTGTIRDVFLIPLNNSGTPEAIKLVDLPDNAVSGGVVFDGFRRSILYSLLGVIYSVNIDDDSKTFLVDLSVTFSQLSSVTDLGVDGYGNIYFAAVDTSARGFIGKIDTSATVTQLYQESTTNQVFNAISVDPIGQSVFGALKPSSIAVTYIKRLEGSTLTNIITTSETITSIAVDIYEQNVYYSDGLKIFYTNCTTPNGQNEFYEDTFASTITDLDVAGDYVYYVGSNNLNVMRINKDGSTGVTRIGPDVVGINWIDVVLASESVLPCATTGIPHATLSPTCYPLPGVSCDYTCDYGYEKNRIGATLTCGDKTGVWDLSRPCRAMDNFIIVRQQGTGTLRDVFMIPLNEPGTSQAIQVADLPDNSVSFGTIFDGYRRSVLYSVLGVIYSVSIDDGTETILADLSASGEIQISRIADLALDTTTGDVYFAGYSGVLYGSPQKKGTIGKIDTNGEVTELYHTMNTLQDFAIDPINRFLFAIERLLEGRGTEYDIVKMDFSGSNVQVIEAGITTSVNCIAVDVTDQTVLRNDFTAGTILKMNYDGSSKAVFYTLLSGSVYDMKVAGDYIYYVVSSTSRKITKVHRLDASNMTTFEPTNGLQYMSYIDVPTFFGSYITKTVCDRQIPNGNLSDACGIHVGDSCDTFTCDYGYNKTEGVGIFNCSEGGNWDYNMSVLCFVPKTVSATTISVITHAKATKPVDPTTVTLKDTGFASGPTSSMTEDISTSTTSTVTTVPVSQSTTQQCGSVRGSLLHESVILVLAGMIAGAILSLSCAVLAAIIKRCITRNNFERTPVAPMNSVTEA